MFDLTVIVFTAANLDRFWGLHIVSPLFSPVSEMWLSVIFLLFISIQKLVAL